MDEGALWFDDEPGVKNGSSGEAGGKTAEEAVDFLSCGSGGIKPAD